MELNQNLIKADLKKSKKLNDEYEAQQRARSDHVNAALQWSYSYKNIAS